MSEAALTLSTAPICSFMALWLFECGWNEAGTYLLELLECQFLVVRRRQHRPRRTVRGL